MNRWDVPKNRGAAAASRLLADLGFFETTASTSAKSRRRPNIVFILVDEMRFPSVFPDGVRTTEEYLRRFMPNVYEL